jgi:hypothetical protein
MKETPKFSVESLLTAMTTNKIFYLSMKGKVVDSENASCTKHSAHFSRITLADVFVHEDGFTNHLVLPLMKKYGKGTRDVICTEDWDTPIGDISRTIILHTWRDEKGELLAMVEVEANHMRECDCKVIPNPIVR